MSRPRSLLVARTLLRRRLRRALTRPKRTALTVLLFVLPLAIAFGPAAFGGAGYGLGPGGTLSNGDNTVAVTTALPPLFSGIWLLFFLGGAFAVDDRLADVDAGSLLVLGGGVRATVLGTTLADHARRVALLSIWFLAGAAIVVAGGGGIASLPLGAVGFGLLVVSASAAGHAVGLFARRELLDRDYDVRATGLSMVGLLYAAYFALAVVAPGGGEAAISLAGRLPTAWFAAWLLLEYPGAAVSPVQLAGSAVFGVTVAAAGFAAKTRLAADVWFRDPGLESDHEEGSDPARRVRSALRPVVGPAAAALAWQVTLRRLRQPKLLLVPVVLALTFWHEAAAALPTASYPLAVVLFAGVAIPPVVALNPLADEGTALPQLLHGGLSGRAFVTGYALAAAVFAWTGTVFGLAFVTVTAGLSIVPTVTAVLVAVPLPLATAAVAVAAGSVMPHSEAHDIVATERIGLPGRYALFAYALVFGIAAQPVALALFVGASLPFVLAATTLTALLVFGAAVAARRLAARRFDAFVLG